MTISTPYTTQAPNLAGIAPDVIADATLLWELNMTKIVRTVKSKRRERIEMHRKKANTRYRIESNLKSNQIKSNRKKKQRPEMETKRNDGTYMHPETIGPSPRPIEATMDCNPFIEARWLGCSIQAFTPTVAHPIKMLPRMLLTPVSSPRYPNWYQLLPWKWVPISISVWEWMASLGGEKYNPSGNRRTRRLLKRALMRRAFTKPNLLVATVNTVYCPVIKMQAPMVWTSPMPVSSNPNPPFEVDAMANNGNVSSDARLVKAKDHML
jgi:hypothetical protein